MNPKFFNREPLCVKEGALPVRRVYNPSEREIPLPEFLFGSLTSTNEKRSGRFFVRAPRHNGSLVYPPTSV